MAINLSSIIKQWQDSMNTTNAANEARYQDILKVYGNTGGQSMMDLVSQLGQSDLRSVDVGEKQAQAKARQSLISRGLGNTTASAAAMRDVSNTAELARQEVSENQLEKQMNVLSGKAAMMGNRTDAGPDAGLFASLIQASANQANIDPQTGNATGLNTRSGGYSTIGSINSVNSLLDAWVNQTKNTGGGGGGGSSSSSSSTSGSSSGGYGGGYLSDIAKLREERAAAKARTAAALAARGTSYVTPSGSAESEFVRTFLISHGRNPTAAEYQAAGFTSGGAGTGF